MLLFWIAAITMNYCSGSRQLCFDVNKYRFLCDVFFHDDIQSDVAGQFWYSVLIIGTYPDIVLPRCLGISILLQRYSVLMLLSTVTLHVQYYSSRANMLISLLLTVTYCSFSERPNPKRLPSGQRQRQLHQWGGRMTNWSCSSKDVICSRRRSLIPSTKCAWSYKRRSSHLVTPWLK